MRISRGYLECDPTSVRVLEAKIANATCDISSGEVSISDRFAPWIAIRIEINLGIDVERIRERLDLSQDDFLIAGIGTYGKDMALRHNCKPVTVTEDQCWLSLEIPPYECANSLAAELTLAIVRESERPIAPGMPRIPFSRVWSLPFRISLTGDLARANVLERDFSDDPRFARAMWRVELNAPETFEDWLVAETSTVVTVLVNSAMESEYSSPSASALLMTDIAVAAIDKMFDTFAEATSLNEVLQAVWSPPKDCGSWLLFLQSVCRTTLGETYFGAGERWRADREVCHTRLQSVAAKTLGGGG